MYLEDLNALAWEEAAVQFLRCCGSTRWARLMSERRPFHSPSEMAQAADRIWASLDREDWLEAFAAHPRIGDSGTGRRASSSHEGDGPSGNALGERDAGSASASHAEAREPLERAEAGDPGESKGKATSPQHWASNEQSGMKEASQDVRARLEAANREYEARFGYIFIVCASGKSADEMLAILARRLANEPSDELRIAAAEQAKITELRLSKLLNEGGVRETGGLATHDMKVEPTKK